MILIPVRSEKKTIRFPRFTIGLIVLNLLIWVWTNHVITVENNRLFRLERALYEIESQYVVEMSQAHVDLLFSGDLEQLHLHFLQNEYVSRKSPVFQDWAALYCEYQALKKNSFFLRWGYIPAQFNVLKLIISLFLHGSIFHVVGNMLYLWIVGCNMEDDWGWPKFLGFFLISGIIAALTHTGYGKDMHTPLIGASGAVAGVMGAYMIQHFKTKIRFGYFYFFFFKPCYGFFQIWAGLVIPFWFLQEYFFARLNLQSGTAHWAHVGGFLFGACLVLVEKYIRGEPLFVEQKEKRTIVIEDPEIGHVVSRLSPVPDYTGIEDHGRYVAQIKEIIDKEPMNYPARLQMARMALQKGYDKDSVVYYNQALETLFVLEDEKTTLDIYHEVKQNELLAGLSDHTVYRLGALLEKNQHYHDAVRMFGTYTRLFPQGIMRAQAIYTAYLILKDKLNKLDKATVALKLLYQDYPNYIPKMQSPASNN